MSSRSSDPLSAIVTSTPEGLRDYLDFRNGSFVEAGAHDGLYLSNTYPLEETMGWSGILVEPIPELASRCRHNRPGAVVAELALVPPDYSSSTIPLTYGGGMSLVRGARETCAAELAHASVISTKTGGAETPYRVEAAVATLSALLDRYGLEELDLLPLDLEGYEPAALRGLDLARHRPRYIVVEVWWWTAQAITEILSAYDLVAVLDHLEANVAAAMGSEDIKAGTMWDALYRLRADAR